MLKRFSFFFIAVVLILSIFAAPALADGQALSSGNYAYTVNGDGTSVTITGYTGTETNIIVPSTLGTYNVTVIGDSAFKGKKAITSVTLPEGVTAIGNSAFKACSALAHITLPSTLKSISDNAFSFSALQSVNIPEGVTAIGDSVFNSCSSLTQIYLPSTLKSISENAFSFSALQSVDIPEGVTLINDSAFKNCTSLETAVLPSTLNSLGDYVFQNCYSLDTVNIPDNITSIPKYTFDECSSLKTINLPVSVVSIGAWAFSHSGIENADFLDNVTDIGEDAFAWCSLKSVELSDKLTSIGYGTFIYCSNLESISIPDGVESIGDYAFNACTALETVTISDSSQLNSIGDWAFCGCTSLKGIDIPVGVSEISQYAFLDCTSLESVNLESSTETDGVKTIDKGAFNECSSLESITFPEALTGISDGAFEDCDVLRDAYFAGDVPSSFGNNVFDGCAPGFTIYYLDKYDFPNPFNGYLTDTYGPKVTYKVLFDLNNGGAGGTDPDKQIVFKNVKAKTPVDPGYMGYYVGGWYTESTCQSANKWSFDTTGVKSDMTLYAKWNPIVYTLTYDPDGGLMSGNRDTYTIEDSDITLNAPTKSGYTFAGWSGTGIYGTSTSVTIPAGSHGNRLYTAHWTVNSYNINFYSDGSEVKSGKADFGSLLTVPAGLTKTNYYIEGWYTDDGTFAHKWNFSSSTMPANDLDLYAHWTGVKVKVTLNPGTGAKVAPASMQISFAGTYGTLPVPTKSGYYFYGWYTGVNGTGTLIKAADTVNSASGVTLYAKWAKASTVALCTPSLTLKVTDYETITLKWNTVKNAQSYTIYRSLGNSSHFTAIVTITDGSLNYTDTGRAPKVKCYYKMIASWTPYAAAVNSSYSSVKSATPDWAAITLKTSSLNYKSIYLSWNTIPGATEYEVYRCDTAYNGTYTSEGKTSGTSFTDTNLLKGHTYYYKIMAWDASSASSPLSAYKSVIPAWPQVTLTVSATDYDSATLKWNAVNGATAYAVYRCDTPTGDYTLLDGNVTSASYTDNGLITGKTYYYIVKAYDGAVSGECVYSAYKSVRTVPDIPAGLMLTPYSAASITVSWNAAGGATMYEVYRATSLNGAYTKITATPDLSFLSTGLITGKTYYYKVRAYCTFGASTVNIYSINYSAIQSLKI